MKKRNITYGSLITAFGVFIFIYAGRYANTTYLGKGSTGGEFFPRIMSAGLVVTGLIIIATALLSKQPEETGAPIKWIDLLINVAALIVYYLLLKPLGFIVDSAWATAFIMYRFGCRNYVALVIWSLVMPAAIFCLFYYGLYVGLPLGILAPILPKY